MIFSIGDKIRINNKYCTVFQHIKEDKYNIIWPDNTKTEEVLSENNKITKKISYKQACELISKWFKEDLNIEKTSEEIFNYSSSGELFYIFDWYYKAKQYFEDKERDTIQV